MSSEIREGGLRCLNPELIEKRYYTCREIRDSTWKKEVDGGFGSPSIDPEVPRVSSPPELGQKNVKRQTFNKPKTHPPNTQS